MTNAQVHSHDGWDRYYKEQAGKRAWNGIPDQYLMDNFSLVLTDQAESVLDIASGDGRNAEPFLDRGLSVIATDLSPSGLMNFSRRCREESKQQPVLISGDFLSLEFTPEQFDCIVCFNSLPHFEVPQQCLEKMLLLLKPGGRAAFNAFTPGDVAWGLGDKLAENVYSYRDTLFTFLTESDVLEILPSSASVLKSETRRWEEPDHGSYRTGTHTHEACFFVIEKSYV